MIFLKYFIHQITKIIVTDTVTAYKEQQQWQRQRQRQQQKKGVGYILKTFMLQVNIWQKPVPFPKMFCKFVPARCNSFFQFGILLLILALKTCNEGFTLFNLHLQIYNLAVNIYDNLKYRNPCPDRKSQIQHLLS